MKVKVQFPKNGGSADFESEDPGVTTIREIREWAATKVKIPATEMTIRKKKNGR